MCFFKFKSESMLRFLQCAVISLTGWFWGWDRVGCGNIEWPGTNFVQHRTFLQSLSFSTVPHCRGILAAVLDPQHHIPVWRSGRVCWAQVLHWVLCPVKKMPFCKAANSHYWAREIFPKQAVVLSALKHSVISSPEPRGELVLYFFPVSQDFTSLA